MGNRTVRSVRIGFFFPRNVAQMEDDGIPVHVQRHDIGKIAIGMFANVGAAFLRQPAEQVHELRTVPFTEQVGGCDQRSVESAIRQCLPLFLRKVVQSAQYGIAVNRGIRRELRFHAGTTGPRRVPLLCRYHLVGLFERLDDLMDSCVGAIQVSECQMNEATLFGGVHGIHRLAQEQYGVGDFVGDGVVNLSGGMFPCASASQFHTYGIISLFVCQHVSARCYAKKQGDDQRRQPRRVISGRHGSVAYGGDDAGHYRDRESRGTHEVFENADGQTDAEEIRGRHECGRRTDKRGRAPSKHRQTAADHRQNRDAEHRALGEDQPDGLLIVPRERCRRHNDYAIGDEAGYGQQCHPSVPQRPDHRDSPTPPIGDSVYYAE